MDIKKEIGGLAENVSEKDVKKAIDTVKTEAKKIDNDKVKKAVDQINVSDDQIKSALDAVKKL